MSYWEILLEKQQERGKDGLTLPFLIGSQKYLPEYYDQDDIEDLILDIASSSSFETCIRTCIGTQTFIFEKRKQNNMVYYPSHFGEEQKNLSISVTDKSDLGETIEELIENLTEEFQDNIDNELFSAEPNVDERFANWRGFTYEDILFIQESFKSFS